MRAPEGPRGARAALPRLHVVTTREVLERREFGPAARALLEIGGVALHLRARGDNGRLLLIAARELAGAAGPGAALLVNDRVDVAWLAGCGAHLPEAGLTPAEARTILGTEPLLGRSIHGPEAVDEVAAGGTADASTGAAAAGPPAVRLLDYVIYGHVFATASKPAPPRGLAALEEVTARAAARGLPVLAIGGVTPDRVADALAAGAHGVAVLSGVWQAADPVSAAARYGAALAAAGGGYACASP